MKKSIFYYLLLLLPFTFAAVSCSDDDEKDIPNVGIQATVTGGVVEGNNIYVVQGDTLTIDAVNLINKSGKDGAMGAVTYYWDRFLVGTNVTVPFSFSVNTAAEPVGRHLLQAQMPIYVVDYPICWGYFQYYVNIVPTAADLPGQPDGTPALINGTIQVKD